MEMSVREARANFAHALEAAERGERITITKNGKPIAEIGPAIIAPKNTFSWERLDQVRREMGLDKSPPDLRSDEEWFADFNDPVFTRMMLGEPEEESPDQR